MPFQLGRHFDPAHVAKAQIQDNHVRTMLSREGDGFFSTPRFRDDGQIFFVIQQAGEAAADKEVVIHEEKAELFGRIGHKRGRGRVRARRVPSEEESTTRSASICFARSCIPWIPK